MTTVLVHGLGAVSPAGWGVPALRAAIEQNTPLPARPLARPGWSSPLCSRVVPPPGRRLDFLAHPRLRRASPISQYVVAAALEALGQDLARVQAGSLRLGVVVGVMAGGVSYSRRFFEEALKDPATASPLIFPETVFNAPASHLAAFLGSSAPSSTLVGDEGVFLQALALAGGCLRRGQMEGCLVIGTEETDWIVADALRLFTRRAVHSAGAGALFLKPGSPEADGGIELACVTDAFPFLRSLNRSAAARQMRAQLPGCSEHELLCLGTQGLPHADAAELAAWQDWTGPRQTPKAILGEALVASAAWQCVLACDALQRREFAAANVSVVGVNQQAIGARFVVSHSLNPL